MNEDEMKNEYDFSKGKRGPVIPMQKGKERITIRLDADILDWFRSQVNTQGGGNYQTLINKALLEYIQGEQINVEDILRRVLREELAHYDAGQKGKK